MFDCKIGLKYYKFESKIKDKKFFIGLCCLLFINNFMVLLLVLLVIMLLLLSCKKESNV